MRPEIKNIKDFQTNGVPKIRSTTIFDTYVVMQPKFFLPIMLCNQRFLRVTNGSRP